MKSHSYGIDILGAKGVITQAGTTGAGLGTRQLKLDTSWMESNAPSAAPPALAVVEKSEEEKAKEDALRRYEESQRKLGEKAAAEVERRGERVPTAMPPPAGRRSITEHAWFWPATIGGALVVGFLGYKAFSGSTRAHMLGGAR